MLTPDLDTLARGFDSVVFRRREVPIGVLIVGASLLLAGAYGVAFGPTADGPGAALAAIIGAQLAGHIGIPSLLLADVAAAVRALGRDGGAGLPRKLADAADRAAKLADDRPALRRPLTWVGFGGGALVLVGLAGIIQAYVGRVALLAPGLALGIAGVAVSGAVAYVNTVRTAGALVVRARAARPASR